jgi:plastocyanin
MNKSWNPPRLDPAWGSRLLAGLVFHRRRLAAALLVALILTYSPPQVQARSQTMKPNQTLTTSVNIENFDFSPQVVVIQVGESVTWTSHGGVVIHTTTSDNAAWDSGDLADGQSFSHTFDTPGRYDYHCMHHPTLMTGTVIVVKPQIFLPELFSMN